MISRDYIITAVEGIHARPAATLIKLVRKYKSAVSLKKGENLIRLNSMLNILTLQAKGGDTITVIIEGEDEADATLALDNFFEEQLKKL